jgi:membrane dipeptidase
MLSFLLGAAAAKMNGKTAEPANMNQPQKRKRVTRGREPTEPLLPQRDWPAIYRDQVVWDAHACLPLVPNADMSPLKRHLDAGVTYVSVNVGMDFNPLADCIRVIAGFRDWIARHDDHYCLAGSVADVTRAKKEGKLAVSFDLEGSMMLDDDLAMIGLYRDLGVRQIHLAYNRDNQIAGGCHGVDQGLTDLGRDVVKEINRVGMIMDCSHSSRTTSLEIMQLSSKPVVFSHSNPKGMRDHPRNVDDTQIKACAETGGIIAINGIGPFLGDDKTETILAHIDYVVKLVGVNHVGIGIDYSFDQVHTDLPPGEDSAYWWPKTSGVDFGKMAFVPPERWPAIAVALLQHGYDEADTAAILGGNFMRVAGESWA